MNTGERVIATEDGIIKVRSIRRKMESERWSVDECANVRRFPWRPDADCEDDEVHIRAALPVTPPAEDVDAKARVQRDGDAVPRPFSIQRRDLINYGYTPGFPGCLAAANDRPSTAGRGLKRLCWKTRMDPTGSKKLDTGKMRT